VIEIAKRRFKIGHRIGERMMKSEAFYHDVLFSRTRCSF
jgi:hypothetical protein